MFDLLADTTRLRPLKFKLNFIIAHFCTLYYYINNMSVKYYYIGAFFL